MSYLKICEDIFRKSIHELDLMVQEAKSKMEQSQDDEVAYKIAKLDYVLILFALKINKYQDFDCRIFEDIYEEL